MLTKLLCYTPSYLLTPSQFPPRLLGEQCCGTWCPPVKLKASRAARTLDLTALHIKAVGDIATTPHSSRNISIFLPYCREGGEKHGHVDDKENRVDDALERTRILLSPNPQKRKREAGGEKVETRNVPPFG